MNPSKLELLHLHREFIEPLVEVSSVPYYGMQNKQHLIKKGEEKKKKKRKRQIGLRLNASYLAVFESRKYLDDISPCPLKTQW